MESSDTKALKVVNAILAGAAQWAGHRPANQKVTVDSQLGHVPGLGVQCLVGGGRETTNQYSSPSLSPSL